VGPAPFIQIATARRYSNKYHPHLYALDADGFVWVYEVGRGEDDTGWKKLSENRLPA
jgi:hypothetical protein